ncbi:3'(2'), 5'-bisphosphate nucleotidase [Allocatelliglobosispora scoriae]|uniref:3'(2'), 5'-bisphosphate nucleotidase n=1 Tax=Allocatelliglobosispora scoriae TaxID=643052 RepID=A0A841BHK2_9ACTN|nr:inositol monophosphatase family protein [Allocatelliglobosispora scoriae]MBB5866659.1 3'(2'), 5'-bisphosphate nucleotidase [Allocatelliglobosispora scoriae]
MEIASLWLELESVLTPVLAEFRARPTLRVEQKADATLLSEADEAVQGQIIRCIRAVDPDAVILGEEGAYGAGLLHGRGVSKRAWIIDPIDGTAQFVKSDGREFCSVVCLVEDRRPVAAFVLAPEIGPGRTPVCVRLTGPGDSIEVNGMPVDALTASGAYALSMTRSSGTPERVCEEELVASGYRLKTCTTSQTLDMVRACVDLESVTDPALEPFGLFYRERQKIWDGAAGLCLAYAAGLNVTDRDGRERTEIDIALDLPDPVFDSTLIASDPVAARIVVAASGR